MTNYDSFSHCHLTDIFFRFSRGSKRVKSFPPVTGKPFIGYIEEEKREAGVIEQHK